MSFGTITCLCGAINAPLSEPLPGKTELCHCNPCRYTSGALFVGWVDSHDSPPSADVLEKCAVYHSSKTHDRYFCSTCGTKTFLHMHHRPDGTESNLWFVFGGAIDPPPGVDNVLNVVTNEWLDDTGDGGFAPFMTKLDGRTLPSHKFDRKSEQITPEVVEDMMRNPLSTSPLQPEEMLKAECHCGGVSLRIEQAKPDDKSISQLDRFIPKTSDGKPTGKHMAFCCVCRYCRLHSGASLTPWIYVPPVQVINPHTNRVVAQHHEVNTDAGKEANKGLTLTHYQSRQDAYRSFCNVCGASVFYSNDRRPEIVNVAPGLLRAEGIMAQRWLSWQWGRTAWKDETTQRDVTDAWRATAERSDLT